MTRFSISLLKTPQSTLSKAHQAEHFASPAARQHLHRPPESTSGCCINVATGLVLFDPPED